MRRESGDLGFWDERVRRLKRRREIGVCAISREREERLERSKNLHWNRERR
jgi:hypothetical protein